jgi:hypothetical protein
LADTPHTPAVADGVRTWLVSQHLTRFYY